VLYLQSQFTRELQEYNTLEDCPVFDGLYQYCQVGPMALLGSKFALSNL
jgi:hypothetical protein